MSDLVERLRKPVKHERREGFYTVTTYAADPLRAEAASRISQQDAELERWKARAEYAEANLAETRRVAFIEAAEIIRARMPLYTEPQALNACRECISSIESAGQP